MVNATATPDRDRDDRRERSRAAPGHASVFADTKLNPFGDLHTLQHLSARLARSMRPALEPLVRREVRCWAEPLVVQRFADYRAERPEGLTAWLPLAMASAATPVLGQALLVLDGRFVLELLDLFFGGTGQAPPSLPTEFTPAADAMAVRLGTTFAGPLAAAWEPLARIEFVPLRVESNAALIPDLDGDDAVIITRFGVAAGDARPVFVDLLYPVTALKPHGTQLTGKVVGKSAEVDPAWRTALTRAAMGVRFPVRSVLAEPVISLSRLMDLKPGDVIPISFGPQVPVMVGGDRFGLGTVGSSNGQAAVQITQLARIDEEDHR